jgi:tetratricopeptide (TPR) repeat protein
MLPGPEPVRPAADEDWSALTDAVKRFDDAWRRGPRPAIDDHLPAAGGLRRPLLIELVHIDLELRLKAGEAARAEEYLARYPELADDRAAAVDLIAAEHELRRRGEPHLSLGEYLRRFPQYREDLSGQIAGPTLAASGGDRDAPRRRADPRRDAPPAVAGYEVLELLGSGGMGVVFKARQLSLGRLVALKFLPEECARDPLWLERFRREACTASSLNHPHICTIHDTGECDGRPFLSMELIEGRPLDVLVGRPLPVDELARMVGQAARALRAAHDAGVVHRDVKPANLMVRDDGIVKVLDFGLARRLPGAGTPGPEPGGKQTDPGTRVGTVLYMAPEQARAEPVGPAADIFSLGVVLYELAAGRHPFLADTEVGVLHAILTLTPPPPSRLNPEAPAPLDGLVRRMLAKDPGLRPSAAEVDAALSDLAAGRPGRPAVPAPVSGKRPTVGRRQELEALRAGFESAAAGRGLMLCVAGEPGIGKTTLVEDFLDELAADGRPHDVARGRCSERLAGAEAYLPFLEALDNLLRGEGGPDAARVMRLTAPAWYAQLTPHAPAGAPADATGASQERLKRELVAFLEEASRLRPLVLFLDDVHWADGSTVDLLAHLGVRCAGLRLLAALTCRPADLALGMHPFGPVQLDLQGRGLCREISLGFLGQPDVERYLDLRFPGHDFPAEFAAVLRRRTGGNPLFLVELLQYLCDGGVIAAPEGRWALARELPDLRREMPPSVRALIRRKIEQLAEADRRLLTAAGVQGHEFDAAVVARALGREAAEVEERLAELDRVHAFVHLLGEHELPDRTLTARYAFVHVFYQNALYASLQPTRKKALSAAVASAVLDCYGERNPDVAAELAFLFEAARDYPRAAEYFLHAAENAVRVSANQEAAAMARRGLDMLQELPDSPDRSRRERALLLALGVSLVATQGFAAPEVEQTYERARGLCQAAEALSTLFPVLYGLWNVYLVRCELGRCKGLAEQMFALAEGPPDPDFLLAAHNVLQQPLFHLGEFAAARRHQEQGLSLYDPRRHRSLTAVYGEDPGVGCLAYGAATLWHLGYPDQALRAVHDSRRLAEELSHPFNVAQALYYGAFTHVCRREARRVEELACALMDLCEEQGFALLFAGGMVLHGWRLTEQGRAGEGIGRMRQGLADWQATGAVSHRAYHLALLAEALGREGREIREALAALDEALELCAATGERFCEAELHRLQGELLLRQAGGGDGPSAYGAAGEAEACFGRASSVARRQGARPLELRAAMSLARLYRRQGRAAEARAPLAAAYDWFTEGFDAPDLREAKALLEGLG